MIPVITAVSGLLAFPIAYKTKLASMNEFLVRFFISISTFSTLSKRWVSLCIYLRTLDWLIHKKLVNFKVFLEDENFISEGILWYT